MNKSITPEKWNALEEAFGNTNAEEILDGVQFQEYETVVRALKHLYDDTTDTKQKNDIASIARRYENKCLGMLYVTNRLYGDKNSEFTWKYLSETN